MEKVVVYSRVHDPKIHLNLTDSPMWAMANHRDEIDDTRGYYQYSFKFDGLTPIQITGIKKLN